MAENEKSPRKIWDLMIGIALILFGCFRLYNRLLESQELNFRVFLTAGFIIYGGFLIFRYFQGQDKE